MARNPTRAQIAAIEALLVGAEQRVRDAFLTAVYAARGRVEFGQLVAAIEDALRSGNVQPVQDLLRLDQGLLWPLEEALRGTFLQGGVMVDGMLPVGLEGRFGFNGHHPRATDLIRRIGADLVTQIDEQQREAVRLTVTDAVERSRSSREVALDLVGRKNQASGKREGGIVGLSGPQTERYLMVQRLMQTPEGVRDLVVEKDGVLTIRYKVNTATAKRIIAAYKKGTAVAAADRAISETQYKNQLLQQRGQLIAQNEAHTAQAAGRHEAYEQLLERDDVERIVKKWIHGFSREPRLDHLRLAREAKAIDFREGFVMDDGTVMQHPHDPAGGVRHSAGCKCTLFYRVVPRIV